MELDFKKIGKAATDQAINLAGSDWTEEQMQEAIGKAAFAAMIPEPTTPSGLCANECPFEVDDGDTYLCALGWKHNCFRPGPSCPASKGGGDGH